MPTTAEAAFAHHLRRTAWTLPAMPDLSQGNCSKPGVDPDLWSSSVPREQRAAIASCGICPVLRQCEQWALSLPLSTSGILAAMTQRTRQRLQRERRAAS